jgi:hypothetical protein
LVPRYVEDLPYRHNRDCQWLFISSCGEDLGLNLSTSDKHFTFNRQMKG